MWDSIVVGVIIAICVFFVGRKMFRQFKAVGDPTAKLDCGCGCSSNCSSSSCSDPEKKRKQTEL